MKDSLCVIYDRNVKYAHGRVLTYVYINDVRYVHEREQDLLCTICASS